MKYERHFLQILENVFIKDITFFIQVFWIMYRTQREQKTVLI